MLKLFSNDYDKVDALKKVDESQTGMDRLKVMFSANEDGYNSKQITMISQYSLLSTLGGFVIGGVMKSKDAYLNFMENNQATKFGNHLDAKRQLQRVMYLSFTKGGWFWGWRIGLFSTSYITMVSALSVYRGKESLLDYVLAGAMTGALFKIDMGPKGMISGSLLGGFLGAIGGTASIMTMTIAGVSLDDIQNFSKKMSEARAEAANKSRSSYIQQEHAGLIDMKLDDKQFVSMKVEEKEK